MPFLYKLHASCEQRGCSQRWVPPRNIYLPMAASEIARDGRGEATEPRTLQPGRTLRSLRRGPETRPLPRPRRGHLGLGAGGHHRDVAPGLVPFATHGLKLHHPLQFAKEKKPHALKRNPVKKTQPQHNRAQTRARDKRATSALLSSGASHGFRSRQPRGGHGRELLEKPRETTASQLFCSAPGTGEAPQGSQERKSGDHAGPDFLNMNFFARDSTATC